jgi:hypothetical protein
MGISEEKMKIVINNYFKSECDVNTSIREAFEKGFRIGVKKGLAQSQADTPQTDSEITRNSLRTDCNGCKFVGWYDTEFPCVNCIRKNKDYYTSEQTDCPWK